MQPDSIMDLFIHEHNQNIFTYCYRSDPEYLGLRDFDKSSLAILKRINYSTVDNEYLI